MKCYIVRELDQEANGLYYETENNKLLTGNAKSDQFVYQKIPEAVSP